MKIILIGNYKLDKQESMQRFTFMLEQGFKDNGIETEIWLPVVFFARMFKGSTQGMGKWFGYLDKWLLFPVILKYRLFKKAYRSNETKFHVCDHSNAPYLKYLPNDKTVITCHDVLAIRGALGYEDAYCPASGMGKILQKWILKNLSNAQKLASVSKFTLNQLKDLNANKKLNDKNWVVIHNAFNAPFTQLEQGKAHQLLKELNLNPSDPFILHVGSALVRKNRKQLVLMVAALGNAWNGKIYFAGKPIDSKLVQLIEEKGLEDRVVSLIRPSHKQLLALYSTCEAFIFPSLSEGFGWPVIEAQACGAPVIAGSFEPMPEVSGGAAIHVHPEDSNGFAEALLKLKNKDAKSRLIESGFENMKRFGVENMIQDYLDLHKIS